MAKLLEKNRPSILPIPAIPESWYRANGILKKKRKALERHLKDIRNDWNK